MVVASTVLQDVSLLPPRILLSPGADYAHEGRKFQGIPSIAVTPGGCVWATWYGGGNDEGPSNYVTLARSEDAGDTWTEPILAIDPCGRVRAFDPALWCDPLGRLWLFWAQVASGEGGRINQVWDGRAGVWYIRLDQPGDPNTPWSEPHRISDGIMLNKPLVCRDGRWLLPVSIWNEEPKHPNAQGRRLAGVVETADQGQTFTWIGGVDMPDRSFDEHHFYETQQGKVVMLARTQHLAGRSVSHDGGRNWSDARKAPDIPCPNSRFNITRLRSGALLMVNHKPADASDTASESVRKNLSLWLSDDDGATWDFKTLLDPRNGVSYPDADQASDGSIYVIYDYNRYEDKQVLLARFTEEDLRRGHPITPCIIS